MKKNWLHIFLAVLLLCLLMGEYLNINAMPVALGAMLAVNLLGARPAYVTNMALTLIITLLTAKGTGLVTSQTMSVLLTCSLGGLVAIWMMRESQMQDMRQHTTIRSRR